MRAQISFEAMIYFTLAGFALLFGITAVASKWQYISETMNTYAISSFVNLVSENMVNGTSSFRIYVPKGVCNSTSVGNKMITDYGTYYFPYLVKVEDGAFCPDGGYSDLIASYSNGTWLVSK